MVDAVIPERIGEVVSDGGVTLFDTVTTDPPEMVVFPATSRATAVKVCVPFVAPAVFHDIEYDERVSSVPRLTPSSLN